MKQKVGFLGRHGIARRLLSMVLTIAMMLTMIQVFPQQTVVKAAEQSVRLYFELPDSTNAEDWAVNAWENVTVTGDGDHAFRPSTWGVGDVFPALIADAAKSAWAYVDVSGNVTGLQFVNLAGTEYNCWNAQIAAQNLTEAYYSPQDGKWYKEAGKINEIKEVSDLGTFVLAGEEGLAGSSWSITDTNNYFVKIGETSQYGITYAMVPAGTYEYKILQDPVNKGWDLPWGPNGDNRKLIVAAPSKVTFSLDSSDSSKALNEKIELVKAIVADNGAIVKGQPLTLQTSAKYYDGISEEAQDVTISYALKETSGDVQLEGNAITVATDSEKTSVVVTASYNGFTQDLTIPVVAKQYKVKINMCSADPGVVFTAGSSDVYLFENGGSANTVVNMTGTLEDEENHITWVTGETTVAFRSLGIIGRVVAGTWDGGQDKNQYFVIDENADEITLWYVYGSTPVTEKPAVTQAEARYLQLAYTNTALDTLPQFYSWTTGYAAERMDFEDKGNGNYVITVPVSSTCTKVDYVLVLDASGSDWIKDGGDHSIRFPADQKVVCAKMDAGKEPELAVPYNIGYELKPTEHKVAFYYRDDQALVQGSLSDLAVSVDINGTEHKMTYSAANQRFEYVQDLSSERIYYRYAVKEGTSGTTNYILDAFNENQEDHQGAQYSYVDYYKLDAEIQAEVMLSSFHYNQNNVVKFTVDQTKSGSEPDLEVVEASIDVSALGGSSALAIEPELQAVTIAVSRDTATGTYTLPIVVKDQYANEYTTSVNVTVTARTKTGTDDFDWDEAVIYFMVTDRFFDGNAANNTASGANTYGSNEGLYHGGDFAGVTQKLDYLDDLGINTIWITPIVENIAGVTVTGTGAGDVPYNASYHGYWASDFTRLNPTLGSDAEFETLIQEAHKRGIKIMVDIVVNHAGYDTEGTFGDMLRKDDAVVSGDDQKDSLAGLPDFQTEDPDVRAQLVAWQTQWVKDFDIDYFRVDTVKHVEGTTWAALKNALTEVRPEFKMIGEYAGGGYATSGGTLGTGQMDSLLDFDFNGWATSYVKGNLSSIEAALTARNAAIDNTLTTGQFLGSHDEDGFKQNLITNSGMTEEAATAASLVAATLQITAKGQPVIYYGEEIGLTGLNNYPYQTNRYDFDWEQVGADNQTYQHYKKLLAIRNTYTDVFARGDRQTVTVSDAAGYDVISRSCGATTLYVGMNIKSQAQKVSVPVKGSAGDIYEDLYSGATYVVNEKGTIAVDIPAAKDGGTVVLKHTGKSGGSTGSTSEPDSGNNEKPGDSGSEPVKKPWVKDNTVLAAKDKATGITVIVNTRTDGTATVTSIKKMSKKTVTIASTVTVNGVEYTVTKIADNAFANAPKTTKIVLPDTVTTIGANAFAGAKHVKTIVVTSTESVKVSKKAFKGLNTKKITIQVVVSKKGMSSKEYKAFKKALKAAGFKGTVKKINKEK